MFSSFSCSDDNELNDKKKTKSGGDKKNKKETEAGTGGLNVSENGSIEPRKLLVVEAWLLLLRCCCYALTGSLALVRTQATTSTTTRHRFAARRTLAFTCRKSARATSLLSKVRYIAPAVVVIAGVPAGATAKSCGFYLARSDRLSFGHCFRIGDYKLCIMNAIGGTRDAKMIRMVRPHSAQLRSQSYQKPSRPFIVDKSSSALP